MSLVTNHYISLLAFTLFTLLNSQPFDSLLERVYVTMLDLDSAVADVERGLQVLDSGLNNIETDVVNGRLQLYGTGKVTPQRNAT